YVGARGEAHLVVRGEDEHPHLIVVTRAPEVAEDLLEHRGVHRVAGLVALEAKKRDAIVDVVGGERHVAMFSTSRSASSAAAATRSPTSENGCGVTRATPMSRHRPGPGRPGGPWPRRSPAGQPAPGGDPAGVPLVTVVTLCSQGDIDTAGWRPGTGSAADTG